MIERQRTDYDAGAVQERRVWLLSVSVTLTFAAIRIASVAWCGVPIVWAPPTIEIGLLSLVCLAFGAYYLWLRAEAGLAAPLLGLGMVFTGLIGAGEASDLAFYFGGAKPFADPMLAAADRSLGFCWRCYALWLDAHPAVFQIGDMAYRSILAQAPFIVLILALARQRLRLCALVIACQVSVLVTGLIAYGFPALGPYTHYGLTAADHPSIVPVFSDNMRNTIAWLRAGDFTTVPDGLVTGLISFPSFHAAMALAYVWAAWQTALRWPVAMLNAVMVAVTPIDGSHYLTDVWAGFAVGMLSIAASAGLLAALCRSRPDPNAAPLDPSRAPLPSRA